MALKAVSARVSASFFWTMTVIPHIPVEEGFGIVKKWR
jgi:hypothetical protein